MNPTLDLIHNRRSVRRYSPEPLPQEERDAILEATFRAPTAGGMMLYSIIEVDNSFTKEKLAETCRQPFIANAPWVLVFLADYQRWMEVYAASGVEEHCRELGIPFRVPQAGELMLAVSDALVAAQTAVIAAESLGVGSCYVGDILSEYEVHREIFNLPRFVMPVTLVTFGHPAAPDPRPAVPRFDRRFIVHKDQYEPIARQEVDTMFQLFAANFSKTLQLPPDSQNLGQMIYLHKFEPEHMVEMNRSIRRMLEKWE